jgi:hypothetical protein
LVWTAPAGMFVWLALAYSACLLPVSTRHRKMLSAPTIRLAALIACGILAAVVSIRSGDSPGRLPAAPNYAAIRATNASVLRALGAENDILVDNPQKFETTFERALIYSLRRRGIVAAVRPQEVATQFGAPYRADAHPYRTIVTIADGALPAPLGTPVVVRNGHVSVTIQHRGLQQVGP